MVSILRLVYYELMMMLKLWSKLSKTDLASLDQEADTSASYMTLKYELYVTCHGEGGAWRDVYQFVDRPEIDIVRMLKERTVETYEALYDSEPSSVSLGIQIITPESREQLPTIRK